MMTKDTIGVGMIGLGTVGGGVAAMLSEHAGLYARRAGRAVELRRVVVRDVEKARASGLVEPGVVTGAFDGLLGDDVDVVIEVAGGVDTAKGFIEPALRAGKHVVTANKALLAAHGPALFGLAREHGVSIAFEASCGGGIPCVTALQFGLMGNRFSGLYGILNGTCNYILTEMTQKGRSYAEALADAKAKGFAEADETLDVSGADAAQKLAVLASLAFGCAVPESAVRCEGIDTLDLTDVRFGGELGYDIKLIASAESPTPGSKSPGSKTPGSEYAGSKGAGGVGGAGLFLTTRPCFIARDEQLAQVHGSYNALSVVGDAVGHVMLYGAGAGRGPTASAVVSDLLNVVSGWYPVAFAQMGMLPDLHDAAVVADSADVHSRFYVRMDVRDVPGGFGRITTILGDHGISLSAIMQHDAEDAGTGFVPVVSVTHETREGDLVAACAEVGALELVRGVPVVIRILSFAG